MSATTDMPDVLARICADTRAELTRRRALRSIASLDAEPREDVRGFAAALDRAVADGRHGVIAEIKKASPSGGLIRPDFDPPAIARAYEVGGAACLSVLTDLPYFHGEPAHLIAARAACALPVLRKDFMLDPWQVAEARAMGADAILLILAALSDAQAAELEDASEHYGMDVLAEVHDEAELERALKLRTRLTGVNNRNLKTLRTDLATTERLARLLPQGRVLVAESGIRDAGDVARLEQVGARRFLVGESLLRQADVTGALRRLIDRKSVLF